MHARDRNCVTINASHQKENAVLKPNPKRREERRNISQEWPKDEVTPHLHPRHDLELKLCTIRLTVPFVKNRFLSIRAIISKHQVLESADPRRVLFAW
jgi:hypothetical protein